MLLRKEIMLQQINKSLKSTIQNQTATTAL